MIVPIAADRQVNLFGELEGLVPHALAGRQSPRYRDYCVRPRNRAVGRFWSRDREGIGGRGWSIGSKVDTSVGQGAMAI